MLNILIVENDAYQLINMTNSLIQSISNIRLCGLVTTGEQALKLLRTKLVDLIILDLKLPDCSGIDILNQISEDNNKYNTSVIIVASENKLLSNLNQYSCVYNCIHKPYSNNQIIEVVNSLTKLKNSEMNKDKIKEKIIFELKKLNYNFSYTGTKYLIDCIYEAYSIGDIYNLNLTKNIYSVIAKKYGKSINNIKCNITQATYAMYYDCEEKVLEKYFPYFYTMKPKVKEIIFAILNILYN